jgi:hypothetical protein
LGIDARPPEGETLVVPDVELNLSSDIIYPFCGFVLLFKVCHKKLSGCQSRQVKYNVPSYGVTPESLFVTVKQKKRPSDDFNKWESLCVARDL